MSTAGPQKLNILTVKERCFGMPLLYRRLMREITNETFGCLVPLMKACMDGRRILRQFVKGPRSDQALITFKPVDSGSSVCSEDATFGVSCNDHGEKGVLRVE